MSRSKNSPTPTLSTWAKRFFHDFPIPSPALYFLFFPNLSVCLPASSCLFFSFRVFIFTDQFFGSSAKITQLHLDAFIDKDKCRAAERRRQIATAFRITHSLNAESRETESQAARDAHFCHLGFIPSSMLLPRFPLSISAWGQTLFFPTTRETLPSGGWIGGCILALDVQ